VASVRELANATVGLLPNLKKLVATNVSAVLTRTLVDAGNAEISRVTTVTSTRNTRVGVVYALPPLTIYRNTD
jgi:hypothetical protein